MAGTNIAEFYARLGIRVDASETRKIDATLKSIERRLTLFKSRLEKQGALSLTLSKFKVDQKALVLKLGNALDSASKKLVFDITRFHIDQEKLNLTVSNAFKRAASNANLALQPRVPKERSSSGGRGSSTSHGRLGVSAGIGAAGGLTLGRLYGPALAVAAGGYGLGALNRRNQEIQSAELTTHAVVQQAMGPAFTDQKASQAFEWYRQLANRVGFNYLDSANDYNNVLSGITGAGGSVAQGQNIFKGFAEYGRVNHIDKERQKRVFKAISQIAGKDQLMSEELTGQLAESLPGAVSLFSEAYQRQTGKSLGVDQNLTGSDAIKALQAAMKKKQVRGNILDVAAQIASERAAPGLTMSARTSQSEQARFQNATNDLIRLANQSGVESGYARLFKTMNDSLAESGPLVRNLSQGFDELTKKVRLLYLIPQSFQRMLQGKDSYIADLIGPDKAQSIRDSVDNISKSFRELQQVMGETNWADYLKTTLHEVDLLLKSISWTLEHTKGLLQFVSNSSFSNVASSYGEIWNDPRTSTLRKLNYSLQAPFIDATYTKPEDWSSNATPGDGRGLINGDVPYDPNNYDPVDSMGRMNGTIQRGNSTTTVNVGDITIQTQATDAQGIASDLQQQVRQALNIDYSDTRLNYPSVGR